jgi:hypothetical protein
VTTRRYIYSWDDVPAKEQRQVLRRARRGLRHPDRTIARVAEAWAQDTLARGSAVAALLLGLGSGADAGFFDVLCDRRRARTILRVQGR